jgi:tRNA(Ile2) C34 agmatinyltransferase TiaS
MYRADIKVGQRVTVEGVVVKTDEHGVFINICDGELPSVGEFYFSFLQGVRACPPACSECGTDMVPYGQTFRCENCGATSGCS